MTMESESVVFPRDEAGGRAWQVDRSESYRGSIYEIKIEGHLDGGWSASLGGMEITHDEDGYTLLCGLIPDQSALHGVLAQIRDLGLVLVSLMQIDLDDEK